MNSQWKLVPVEPTETMVINGFESEPNECFTDDEVWEQYQEMSGCQQAAFRAKLCWAAMLASAPEPPPADAGEVARLTAERDGLQLSLNTADQTIDDLNAAVSRRTSRVLELESQLTCAVDALNEVVKVSTTYEKPFEIAMLAIGELSASAESAVEYGPTPGCRQCEEADSCGFTDCPECDAQLFEDVNGNGFRPGFETEVKS